MQKKIVIGPEAELQICQNQNEWLAFEYELKKNKVVVPDNQVRVTNLHTGYNSQSADIEEVKPLPVDL